MDTHVKAPFTAEQVDLLNRYQTGSGLHPFTCGGNRTDEAHRAYQEKNGGDFGQLIATEKGWHCPVCGYTQDWCHGFMVDRVFIEGREATVALLQPTGHVDEL